MEQICMKNKPGNPAWKPGVSGNPAGSLPKPGTPRKAVLIRLTDAQFERLQQLAENGESPTTTLKKIIAKLLDCG